MIYYCKIIIKFKHLIVRISIVKIEPIYMKKRSLHKTNFSRENLGFEDEKRAANLEKVEESRVSVKSILPLFPLPWNFNKSRVRGVIEGRTNNPFPRSPLWENTVTDRSPGNRVTLFPGNENVWKVIVRGSFFKEGEAKNDNRADIGPCWRPLCIIVPPWYAAPKRPILGCITFRKCAIPGARWLVFHPSSSVEMLIAVYEPPLLSAWFIDSLVIRAWSPLWNSSGSVQG